MADKKPAKKGKKGYYTRERDAKSAAIKSGLKEGEFHVDYSSKGFSITKKNKNPPVPNAKLHGLGQPDSGEQEPLENNVQAVDGRPHIFIERGSGRYRWADETGDLSNESYGSPTAAEIAMEGYIKNVLGPKDPVTEKLDSLVDTRVLNKEDTPSFEVEEGEDSSSDNPGIEDHPVDEMEGVPQASQDLIKREASQEEPKIPVPILSKPWEGLKAEPRECPECHRVVPTYISEDILRYIEHPTEEGKVNPLCNESEEPVKNVKPATIPVASFTPSDLAVVAANEEKLPGDLTKHHTRLRRSQIEGPTKEVWNIAEEMRKVYPNCRRKDIIAECVKRGIALYTARTQFQQWTKIMKESAANAAKANTQTAEENLGESDE